MIKAMGKHGVMKKYLLNGVLGFSLAVSGWAAAEAPRLEPIKTFSPRTAPSVEIKVGVESFQGVELDEAEEFDGWTAAAEMTVPFAQKFQMRLAFPFRTEGDAVVKDEHFIMPGESIDIEGSGGVFDFLTLTFEHELLAAKENGYGLAYYLGGGAAASSLDTTLKRPGTGTDKINHQGTVYMAGIKVERAWGEMQTLSNLGLRYYHRSDDLNPGGSDQFAVADLRFALMFSPWGRLYPVLEFTYLGDLSDMNQVTLLPEVLLPLNEHIDLKAGAAVGLGGNGNELGGQAQVTVKF